MNVERNMPVVRERKLAILKGDPELCDQQKKAGKLIARERIGLLLDAASFVELDVLNSEAGVVTGYGLINGSPVYVYAQDFTVKGGSVGADHARKVLKVMNLAEKTGAPIVAILDTAGARLDEGIDAMNAYAQMAGKVNALSGVVPQIALVLGPCGGIASAIAGMSDITVMSRNGQLFVNGPMVVSAVAGKNIDMETLAGACASEKSGMAQLVAQSDEDAIAAARKLISLLPANNMADAEEVLQDTLLKLLTAAPTFESEEHKKAWLLRVTVNLSKNRIEYNALRNSDELSERIAEEGREDLSFVWDAVKELPVQFREVIHLHYYEGYSTEEIAKILGRNPSTVRSDLRRGREKLKTILKEAYDFEV